jgi:ferric-dicitrate binding protein FerR (iron transport regulator)
MNSPDHKETELQRRERELQERENAIRLRELEAEIEQAVPIYQTGKHEASESKFQQWRRKLTIVAQFTAIVIAVGVAVMVSSWLATAAIVGGLSWVIYKIMFDKDRPKN